MPEIAGKVSPVLIIHEANVGTWMFWESVPLVKLIPQWFY